MRAALAGGESDAGGHAASAGYYGPRLYDEEDAVVDTEIRDAPNPTAFRMQQVYRLVQEVVSDVSEEQLRWQPNPTTPSIRFHLFHIARWGDVLLQRLTGADRQLWHAEGIADRWGFDPMGLGVSESGEMLDDETAMALPLPERVVLLAYCDRIFAAADQALAAIGDEDMRRAVTDSDGASTSLSASIAGQLSHTARHLGMIECLRGIQGMRGTATD
jgi:DinB superfamily